LACDIPGRVSAPIHISTSEPTSIAPPPGPLDPSAIELAKDAAGDQEQLSIQRTIQCGHHCSKNVWVMRTGDSVRAEMLAHQLFTRELVKLDIIEIESRLQALG
jgi:hypothetical protein